MALIRFTRGKLLVGLRMQDCREVWMKPVIGDLSGVIDEDSDGTVNPGFLKSLRFKSLGEGYREPMLEEIMWLPLFNPVHFDAQTAKARAKKHLQFLGDAWKYLNENDEGRITELEAELDQPGYVKWQTFFDEAKKFKRVQMRERNVRRNRRSGQALAESHAMGISVDEIAFNSDSSGEDSGFEEIRAPMQSRRKRARGVSANMPAPPLPTGRNRRPRGADDDANGPLQKRQKPKTKPNSKKKQNVPLGGQEDGDPQLISGGPQSDEFRNDGRQFLMDGRSSTSDSGSLNSLGLQPNYRTFMQDLDEGDLADSQSSIFDPTPPEDPPNRDSIPGLFSRGSSTGAFPSGGILPTPRIPWRPGTQYSMSSPIRNTKDELSGYGRDLRGARSISESMMHSRNDRARSRAPGSSPFDIGDMGHADLNAGLSEVEALDRAIRESQPPDPAENARQESADRTAREHDSDDAGNPRPNEDDEGQSQGAEG